MNSSDKQQSLQKDLATEIAEDDGCLLPSTGVRKSKTSVAKKQDEKPTDCLYPSALKSMKKQSSLRKSSRSMSKSKRAAKKTRVPPSSVTFDCPSETLSTEALVDDDTLNPSAANRRKKINSKMSTGSLSSVKRLAESIPDLRRRDSMSSVRRLANTIPNCKPPRSVKSVRSQKKPSLKKKKKAPRSMKPSGSCKRPKKRKSSKPKKRAVSRPVSRPRRRSVSRKKSKYVPKKKTVRSVPAYSYRNFSNNSLYRQQYLDGNGFYSYNSQPRRVYAPKQTNYWQRPIYGSTIPTSPLSCYPTANNTNLLRPSTRHNEPSSYARNYSDAFYPSKRTDPYYSDEYSDSKPSYYDDSYLNRSYDRSSIYDRYNSYNKNYIAPSTGHNPPSYESACQSDEDSVTTEETDYYDEYPRNNYIMPSSGGYRDEAIRNRCLYPSAGVKLSDTSVSTNGSKNRCLYPSAGVKKSDTSVSTNDSKNRCLYPSTGVKKSDTSVSTTSSKKNCLYPSTGFKRSDTSVSTNKSKSSSENPSETCLYPSLGAKRSKSSVNLDTERRNLRESLSDDECLYPSAAVRDSNTSLESSNRDFRGEPSNDCMYPSVGMSDTSVSTEETESMISEADSVATDMLLQPSAGQESESVFSESNESQTSSVESVIMQPSARQDNRRSYQDEDLYEDYETDSYYSEETETATDDNSVDSEDPVGLENVPLTSQGVDRDYSETCSDDEDTESCVDDEESAASSEYYDDDEQMQY